MILNDFEVAILGIVFVLGVFGILLLLQCLSLGKSFLAYQLPARKWSLLEAKAATIVRSLNQAPQFNGYEGAEKKGYALNFLIHAAEKMGLQVVEDRTFVPVKKLHSSVTREELGHIIEAAVNDVNPEAEPLQ